MKASLLLAALRLRLVVHAGGSCRGPGSFGLRIDTLKALPGGVWRCALLGLRIRHYLGFCGNVSETAHTTPIARRSLGHYHMMDTTVDIPPT